MQERFTVAMQDFIAGIKSWRIWLLLGWQDIRLRYRRSQIGPFWLTISMAINTYSLGFLYGNLFKMELNYYFPFLAAGLLTWTLLATIINEGTNALIEAAGYLKQMKLPCVIFILRIVTRNIIIFAHNIVPVIPIMFYCHISIGWHTLLLFVGLLIIAVSGVVYGLVLGMLGARFRDIGQIISSLTQVMFFITPVMWMKKSLPVKYAFLADYNPFSQYIELIRAPLMGMAPSLNTYLTTIIFTLFGFVLMISVFYRVRHRIIYWL